MRFPAYKRQREPYCGRAYFFPTRVEVRIVGLYVAGERLGLRNECARKFWIAVSHGRKVRERGGQAEQRQEGRRHAFEVVPSSQE